MIAGLLYGNDIPTADRIFDQAINIMACDSHDDEDLQEVAEGLLDAYAALAKMHGEDIEFVETEEEKTEAFIEGYLMGYGQKTDTECIWLPYTIPSGAVPKRALLILGEVQGGRDHQRLRSIQREMDRMEREGVA